MTWVCDNCYSAMEVSKEGRNRYKVKCPECGTYWFIDEDDEIINDGSAWSPKDDYDDEDDDGEGLSVYDAALIWASHGKDEEYTFGYTEDELEDALD